MALAITKMSNVTVGRETPIRAIVYGPAGAGKTTLAGTFPKPILFFDFDKKMRPLYGMEDVDVISYDLSDMGQASMVYNQFKRDLKEAKKDPKYKSLCFDSLTNLDLVLLRHCVLLNGKLAPEAAATLQVYGEQSNYYSFLFSELRTIAKNILVTAHEFYNIDGENGIHSILPLITGKAILAKLPALFEEVWYMMKKGGDKDDSVLYYRTPNGKKFITNSLFLAGGAGSVDNPTFDKLLALGKGK